MQQADIHFRRIGWQQTLDVIKLSRSLLPAELCRKTHSLLALFINLERRNHNLSFGLYCGDELVGYMLVYFHDRSLYHQRDELIVHIDEYCVKSDYRGRGRDVISRMVHEMELWQPKSGIEAIATGEALQHWLSIGRLVSRWGYETHLRENDCVRAGHQMGRIRWEFKKDEYWRPTSAQKLPKPVLSKEISDKNIELLLIKSPRQWLTLQTSYAELEPMNARSRGSDFDYQWEYWRHFGISEQLNVLVLREEGSVQVILPLSLAASVSGKSDVPPVLIADNSAYPTAQPLLNLQRRGPLLELMQLCVDEAGLKLNVGLYCEEVSTAGPPARPRQWFGLNRRNVQLHSNFKRNAGLSP